MNLFITPNLIEASMTPEQGGQNIITPEGKRVLVLKEQGRLKLNLCDTAN